jgi:two-component system, NarL family, response regulator LiaR
MIRVLICDDQDVVREGLQAILKTVPDLQVVGAASDGAEALDLIPTAHPDVVLMDLKMPGMNGIQATRLVREQHPAVRVLVLTTYDADEWVFDAIRSGAAGYILKDTPREGLVRAIQDVAQGRTPVDPAVAGKLFSQISRQSQAVDSSIASQLSERELDVLRLLAHGLSNAEIAGRLHLSEGTVRNYVSAIFTRLGVSDRTQAAVIALRYGLVDLNP